MEPVNIKQESADPGPSVSLPTVKQEPQQAGFRSSRGLVTASTARSSREPGEIDSSPPFPRAFYAPPRSLLPSDDSSSPRRFPASTAYTHHRIPSGPSPELGTPQDRFRQAVLGFDRNMSNQSGRRNISGNPTTARAPTPPPRVPTVPSASVNTYGALVEPGMPPRMDSPTLSAADPQHPMVHVPGPVELLSRECQKRGFNPSWQFKFDRYKKISCEVVLRDQTIKTGFWFDDSTPAKTRAAQMALGTVRSWPVPERTGSNQAMTGRQQQQSQPQRTSAGAGSQQYGPPMRDDTAFMADMAHVGGSLTSPGHNSLVPYWDQPEPLDRSRQVTGMAMPDLVRDYPDLTRVFLEGLAMGARLAGQSSRDHRGRSRSPPAALSRSPEAYRRRSPPRGRERPTLPRINPRGDRYLPPPA